MKPRLTQTTIEWSVSLQRWTMQIPWIKNKGLREGLRYELRFIIKVEQREIGGVWYWLYTDEQEPRVLDCLRRHTMPYARGEKPSEDFFRAAAAPVADLRPAACATLARIASRPTEEITRLTPDELHKLYRRLVARLHPDLGGDADTMADLNVAYATLRK